MKLGLLLVAYQSADLMDEFIAPWLEFKNKYPDKLVLSFGHVCFKENQKMGEPELSPDGTHKILEDWYKQGKIDYFSLIGPTSSEAEARNVCLDKITNQCDYVLTSAFDEIFTLEQIIKLFKYIENDPFVTWFSINYKNFVFDRNTYTLGFCPPRVFKVSSQGLSLNGFYYDDDVYYVDGKLNKIDYKSLPNKRIPQSCLLISHYTWLNNERSKGKVKYQKLRWGKDIGCSFAWDDKENKLVWNLNHFKHYNKEIPVLYEN